ncbi:rhodanese-like domain-containing protein [Pantoea sp. GM01]|uniref:rhodanese-like domain-containing protein n=1 Tax=Pantoea sp. GM01 TaxID=1144320 RepID=UPI0002710ED7|nr:rhodanese-like domain-containing protein [Pantoea sp. GM01]EJL90312.1 rhodanese-related sulfurtransferase [Pantoea sp. GM01]
MIIDVHTLQQRQACGETFLLIDVREFADWQRATLPDAQHCNVYDYFIEDCSAQGLAVMAAEAATALQPMFTAWPGATPVFFEQQVGMRSPRGAWFAWLLQRDDALILDGGVDAWTAAGFELSPGLGLSRSVAHPPAAQVLAWNAEMVCSREAVLAADGVTVINVDARRPSEFDGSFVHACCQRAGRIPHSALLFWEDVIANGHFLPAAEIAARAAAAGLSKSAKLQVYCHRGARAATVLAALKLAGYPHVAIYVGSWHEWAEHHELPLLHGS